MFAIPRQRPPDAVPQSDARLEPELAPRARDVERAALREKIDAPAVQRRLYPERRARRLADGARDPERPRRHVQPRRRDARLLGDQTDQLVERGHLAAGEDVASARGRRRVAAEPEALAQIV